MSEAGNANPPSMQAAAGGGHAAPSHTPPQAATHTTTKSGTNHDQGHGHGESFSLAAMLAPALIAACEDRLSPIEWFRSSWQSGGASTGYATLAVDAGPPQDVVVKLPVGPAEYRWTTALGGGSNGDAAVPLSRSYACGYGPTPLVYASGLELGGYDLAWVIVERFKGGPLASHMGAKAVEDLLSAAAEWYARAGLLRPVSDAPPPQTIDWEARIAKAREALKHNAIHEPQRWNNGIKAVQRVLPTLTARWAARPINTWCHGDFHPGNAMRRSGTEEAGGAGGGAGGCVLIDLALVHPGHWVEDAVYLERLYWGRANLLDGVKPVSFLAKARRDRGMLATEDYTMLANIRRVLMAACVPAYLAHEGHPKYVHAALETLERLLPLVSR